MLHIVMAGREHDILGKFGAELGRTGKVDVMHVDSATAALELIKADCVDLVVVGQSLMDTTPVDCVKRLIRQKPMISCAMLSAMEPDAFHEATEGLGILMHLPPIPSGDDARVLLDKIESLASLLDGGAEKEARQ